YAAPPGTVIVLRVEWPARSRPGVDHIGVNSRVNAGAEHLAVQFTADREDAVSQRFGFKAVGIHPPAQAGFRVPGGGPRIERTRVAVGVREQYQSMRRLPAPTALHEFGREPVEQLWMAGTVSGRPEIARRLHDAFAEMVLPDAIDGHAGRQRVVGAGDPF